MSTLTPELPSAREARGAVPETTHQKSGVSFGSSRCDPSPADERVAPTSRPGPSGPGRGRAGRRARRALARAVSRARERAYGRERARRRLASGQWEPHPGWRHRVDDDLVILIDQVAAWRRVAQLADEELWRADKRIRWLAMLRHLVCSMSWNTGLVCGVTAAHLADIGDCSTRTVSRLLAWAQEVDLLVVVEEGASAAFLKADRNRAPAYVLVAPSTSPAVPPLNESAQLSGLVDKSGDLPDVSVSSKPLSNERLKNSTKPSDTWPAWQIPGTPAERNAAVSTLLCRIGLDHRLVPVWRVRALLARWWADGACVAGLLWMIDHHPDQPTQARGDALRAAIDPIRVLGHRLRPWVGQLHRLPPELAGRHGDYRSAQAARVAERIDAAEQQHRSAAQVDRFSTAAAREAARAALAALLADRARRGNRQTETHS